MQKNRLYFLLGSVALLSSLTLGVNSAQADATVQQSSASVEVQTSTGSETNTKETTNADISVNQNISNVEDGSKHSESNVASSNSISKENEYVSSESKENTSSVSTTVQSSSEVSQHLSQKIATSLSSNTTRLKNGWYSEKDNWYYYNNNNMQKGWLQGGNDWYYFNPINGQMQKSWLQGGNDWYYFNPVSGRMQKNWLQGGNDWYYFNPTSGHMQKSWLQGGNDWYYFSPTSGHMQKGWLQGGKDWYYFSPTSGHMQTGTINVDGKKYSFRNDGRMIKDTWGWPFPSVGEGYFSGAQLFGVNPGGEFRMNGFHDGLDFGSADHPGSAVHAVHSGVVTQIGYIAGLENYVVVRSDEYTFVYQEAFSNKGNISVKVGQQINTGDVIGYRDTSHLHLGITRETNVMKAIANSFNNNGTWLDPRALIKNGIANQ